MTSIIFSIKKLKIQLKKGFNPVVLLLDSSCHILHTYYHIPFTIIPYMTIALTNIPIHKFLAEGLN